MNKGSYSLKWDQNKIKRLQANAINGLIAMGYAISNGAKDRAPYLTGNLIRSINLDVSEKNNGTVYVVAGGAAGSYAVPYARRREFENNKHPNKKYYMKNAFKEVTKNYAEYFKEVTK